MYFVHNPCGLWFGPDSEVAFTHKSEWQQLLPLFNDCARARRIGDVFIYIYIFRRSLDSKHESSFCCIIVMNPVWVLRQVWYGAPAIVYLSYIWGLNDDFGLAKLISAHLVISNAKIVFGQTIYVWQIAAVTQFEGAYWMKDEFNIIVSVLKGWGNELCLILHKL